MAMALVPMLRQVITVLALLSVRLALSFLPQSTVPSSPGVITGMVALLSHRRHLPQHVSNVSISYESYCFFTSARVLMSVSLVLFSIYLY